MSMPHTLNTPVRTIDQRFAALAVANQVRVERAKLKKAIKSGEVKAQAILADPPGYALTMKAHDLLLSVPKFGLVKANRAMKLCMMSPSKTIGGLSPRQRDALVEYLDNFENPPV